MPTVERWAKLEEWNPVSSKQVLEYIRYTGLPVPKDRKTKKPTTSNESINWLLEKTNDPVLSKVSDARKYRHAVGILEDTFLGRDGRMHPQYTFLPDTGRLSSRAPNFQNINQGRDGGIDALVADAIRRTVIPSPGCVLVELDWKAIEALLVGYFAGDADYMRLCRMDPHSYLASHIVSKPADPTWDDERLISYLAKIKKEYPDVRALAKKNNHAGNYDQSAKNRARDMGCSVEDAKHYMEVTDKIAPKVREWKNRTRMQAHFDGQLLNPFGYGRAFFEVFKRREDGGWSLGKEAWEALAFLPQSTCAAMCRETILALPNDRPFWLLVPIHDSLLLECLTGKVSECVEIVKALMVKKWPELDGLVVEVDVKVGTNWAEMKEYKG